MGIIFDLLIVIIAISSLWTGFQKGFFKSIVELFILLASAFISYVITPVLAIKFYDIFIYNDLVSKINNILLQGDALNNTAQKTLDLVNNISVFTVDDVLKILNGHSGNKSAEIEAMLKPIIVNIITLFMFALISGVVCVILNYIFKFVFKRPKLPVFGIIDSVLGLGIGAIRFIVFMFICVIALKATSFSIPSDHAINKGIEESKILNRIYDIKLDLFEDYLELH